MAKTKMKKELKITLIILGVLLVLIVAALLIAPKMIVKTIYKQNFGTRFTSFEPYCRDIAEFEGLEREKHVFTSNEGQKITGYVYTKGDTEPKGLIVLAPGFGGGGHRLAAGCTLQMCAKEAVCVLRDALNKAYMEQKA